MRLGRELVESLDADTKPKPKPRPKTRGFFLSDEFCGGCAILRTLAAFLPAAGYFAWRVGFPARFFYCHPRRRLVVYLWYKRLAPPRVRTRQDAPFSCAVAEASMRGYPDFYDYHPVLRNIRRRGLYFLRTTDRPWCRSSVQACSFQGS